VKKVEVKQRKEKNTPSWIKKIKKSSNEYRKTIIKTMRRERNQRRKSLGDRDRRCIEPSGSLLTPHPRPCCRWRGFIREAEELQRVSTTAMI